MKSSEDNILEVTNLCKTFEIKDTKRFTLVKRKLKAVNDVSFSIKKGEVYGLVGESGCGKSTLGRCILQLIKPTSGSVKFMGEEITNASSKRLKELRKEMQIIFQNPYASMNPRLKIGNNLTEVLKVNNLYKGHERERIIEVLDTVGVNSDAMDKYPHQFSGGQLQRLAIARALLVEPKFIVADECVSALDVSVQAQVINLLIDLKEKMNLTILFIAHDLSVVEHISDKVGVMYLGKFVETSSVEKIYSNPKHPYTKALLSAIPIPDPSIKFNDDVLLEGDTPSPIDTPPGCPFHDRCPTPDEICDDYNPRLKLVDDGHYCACSIVPEKIIV